MSTFVEKPTITLIPDPDAGGASSKPHLLAILANTANALVIRPEEIAVFDVRHMGPEKWRATLYVKGIQTPFNIDGSLSSTQKLCNALQLPLKLHVVTEEKL